MALGKFNNKTPKASSEVTSKNKVSTPKTKTRAPHANVEAAEAVTVKSRKKSVAVVNVDSTLQDSVVVRPANEPLKAMAAAAGQIEPTVFLDSSNDANGSPYDRPVVTREQIAHLAYQYWAERGFTHGSAEEDWNRAEAELRRR